MLFATGNSTANIASVGYRYRKWNIGNNIELICRTEHDAVMTSSTGETCFINVKVCTYFVKQDFSTQTFSPRPFATQVRINVNPFRRKSIN